MTVKQYFSLTTNSDNCLFNVKMKTIEGWVAYQISYDEFIEKCGCYEIESVSFSYDMFVGKGVFIVWLKRLNLAKLFE